MCRPVVSCALAVLGFIGIPCASQAQWGYDPAPFVPRLDISVGFNYIFANSPPNGTDNFNVRGGYVGSTYAVWPWLSVAGEVTGERATTISDLGQDLTLATFNIGPRLVLRRGRLAPFAQALFGGAHAADSYFPGPTSYSRSDNSFAFTTGGGVDYEITHRFAVRGKAQYLHTAFENGSNNSQNHLMTSVGLAVNFGGFFATPHTSSKHVRRAPPAEEPSAPAPRPPAVTPVEPPPAASAPMLPSATGPVSPLAEPIAAAPSLAHDTTPHVHLSDVYFDYDKADLRNDTQATLQAVITWLQDNPSRRVRIAGYSDERGTPQYNLSLGEKRAEAVRDTLVNAGIDSSRVLVESYGNAVQVCMTPAEPCYRRNRRVEFVPLD